MSIRESAKRIVEESTTKQVMRLANTLEISSRDTVVLAGAPLFGQIIDATSTIYAIKHGGFVEANPIAAKFMIKNMTPFVAVKLGVGAFMAYTVKKQLEKGNKKAAKVLSGIGFLAGAGPTINNVIQLVRR